MRLFIERLICFLLAFSTFLCVPVLAEDADINVVSKEETILMALGFLPEEVEIEKNIDRKTFGNLVSSIAAYGNEDLSLLFDGIDLNSEKAIKIDEALRVLVHILGYDIYAASNGGYPTGVKNTAVKIGLLDGVEHNSAKPLSYDVIIKLLYNAIHIDIFKPAKFGVNVGYVKKEDATLLSEYHNIVHKKGVVEKNAQTGISERQGTDDSEMVVIEGVQYIDKSGDASELLGYKTEFYAKKDKYADYDEILYIAPVESNNVFKINANEIDEKTTEKTFYYVLKGASKRRSLKLADSVCVIYNGAYLFGYSEKHLMPESGNVTLIDNNNDGKIDIVIVKDYEIFKIKAVDAENLVIYTEDSTENILLKEYEAWNCSIIKNKERIELKDLTPKSVISVAKSIDDSIIEISVYEKKLKGVIKTLYSDALFIKGEKIPISKALVQKGSSLRVGNTVELYVDIFGEAIWCEKTDAYGEYYAYLIDIGMDNGLDETKAKIKLLMPEDEVIVKPFSEHILLNGRSIKHSKMVETLENTKQLIRVLEDDEGNVERITTAVDNTAVVNYKGYDDDNFSADYQVSQFRVGRQKVSGLFNYDDELLAFYIPTDEENYDMYKAEKSSEWTSDSVAIEKPITLYDVTRFAQPSAIVIKNYDEDMSGDEVHVSINGYDTYFFAIENVEEVLDEDGMIWRKLSGYSNGVRVEYAAKDDNVSNVGEYVRVNEGTRLWDTKPNTRTKWGFTDYKISDLKSGDVIQIALDGKKRIIGFRTIFSNDIKGIDSPQFSPGELFEICATDNSILEPGMYTSQMYTAYAEVTDVSGEMIRYKTNLLVDGVKTPVERAVKVPPNIYIYNERSKVLEKGKTTDVRIGDIVYVHSPTGQGQISNVLVIR